MTTALTVVDYIPSPTRASDLTMLMTQSPVSPLVTVTTQNNSNIIINNHNNHNNNNSNNNSNNNNSSSKTRSRSRSNTLDKNPDSAIELSDGVTSSSSAHFNGDHDFTYAYTMNGTIGTQPPGTLYVRALYEYEADDRTSLSFHEGDVIQVITQLESGWWDGVINGVRGWFPSNYCQIITSPDEIPDTVQAGDDLVEDELVDRLPYEEELDDEFESDQDELNALPLEGTSKGQGQKSKADFWIPQATSDGRLYYFNTQTGERSVELPLESPTSFNENGPPDRMKANMPEYTRPPPELMAGGMIQDEDEDSELTSASEAEGESLMSSMGSLVSTRDSYLLVIAYSHIHP